MKALHLALVRQRYTAFGGAEQFLKNAMTTLTGNDINLTLITREWQQQDNVQRIICNPFYIGRLWRDRGFARAACRLLHQNSFDVVQSHERMACCDIYRAGDGVHREWLTQRRRTLGAFGALVQDTHPYHRYTLAAEEKLFNSPRLQALICNSQMVKNEILYYFNIAPDKLHVIYNSVDLERYHPGLVQHAQPVRRNYGIPSDESVFLFAGSGFYRKGLTAALYALHAHGAGAHLLVVGKDKAGARFERLARKLGLGERVHFVGPQTDMTPFYGASDALLLPTLYDPFPNVALEALACGLPVITSHKSGASEIIVDGVNGYVCDALDIDALAIKLEQCCKNAPTMRTAARQSVTGFTHEVMVERLITLYQSILAKR